MRFPPSLLDEIRARLPLSQVVGRHVQWDRRRSRPSRGDWWACCPFHQEKTPSFHADDRRGRYYCFGCHAKGDIFTFLVEKEGASFAEAVERLAAEAGVALPAPDPEAARREEERTTLLDVLEHAATFFERSLRATEGAAALAYARDERGLDEETISAFRLGFAPDARDALFGHLRRRGISRELMERAGLVVVP
ncbi:MAG TPA: DNA primase, partial [Thermopetrobacter sp.]|nr:DNA primase [Thermopetrobacter sp.]